MKQEHPQKKAFFDLLNRAVRKGEKVNQKKQGGDFLIYRPLSYLVSD